MKDSVQVVEAGLGATVEVLGCTCSFLEQLIIRGVIPIERFGVSLELGRGLLGIAKFRLNGLQWLENFDILFGLTL